MTEHADIEALSAYVDGEAPEWADHVARCAECRATADSLRAVAAAVAAPVEPAPPGARESAVALALGSAAAAAAAARADNVRPSRRRRRPSPVAFAAVAAAVLAFVLGSTLLLTYGTRSSGNRTTKAAGPLQEASPSQPAAGDSAAVAPATDLGDVPDAATLLARARGALSASRAADGGNGGAASAAASPAASATSPAVGGLAAAPAPAPAPTPATVGTRPCEDQARARQPSLGPVVYFATARRQGVPAVVLGFSSGPGSSQVTLLLLAQDGCAELLRAVGP